MLYISVLKASDIEYNPGSIIFHLKYPETYESIFTVYVVTVQPKIIQVILSIYIHCENCGKKIKQNIEKMAGTLPLSSYYFFKHVTSTNTLALSYCLCQYINEKKKVQGHTS